jgi:hypothetical protein
VRQARWSVLFSFVLACSTGEDAGAGNSAGEQRTCAADDTACAAARDAEKVADKASIPSDGQKNGTESDVDCGGAGDSPRCADGKACTAAGDCVSSVCTDGTCQAPRGDDGAKNGEETDVDCGGAGANTARCGLAKGCKSHGDCESDGCGYDGKCALARSCAGHFGGDTCGSGEVGEPGAKHESCCEAAPVDGRNGTRLDKYVITAGRMRKFVERTNGNVRAFAEGLQGNDHWKQEWNDMLPASVEEANFVLGPTGHGTMRRGCDLEGSRGRTYWMSDAENDALSDGHHAFTKDILDQKALNCVEFFMLQALCIWDGGRLATQAELTAAWQAGEDRNYPWGDTFDPNKVVFNSNYQFPEVYDQGNFIYIAAPGRKPEGLGKFGHADLAGLVFEITNDLSDKGVNWSGSGSWEGHGVSPKNVPFGPTEMTRAYWAAGGRCARPE